MFGERKKINHIKLIHFLLPPSIFFGEKLSTPVVEWYPGGQVIRNLCCPAKNNSSHITLFYILVQIPKFQKISNVSGWINGKCVQHDSQHIQIVSMWWNCATICYSLQTSYDFNQQLKWVNVKLNTFNILLLMLK